MVFVPSHLITNIANILVPLWQISRLLYSLNVFFETLAELSHKTFSYLRSYWWTLSPLRNASFDAHSSTISPNFVFLMRGTWTPSSAPEHTPTRVPTMGFVLIMSLRSFSSA